MMVHLQYNIFFFCLLLFVRDACELSDSMYFVYVSLYASVPYLFFIATDESVIFFPNWGVKLSTLILKYYTWTVRDKTVLVAIMHTHKFLWMCECVCARVIVEKIHEHVRFSFVKCAIAMKFNQWCKCRHLDLKCEKMAWIKVEQQ